ncbi:hypothetical protein ACHWQZ_G008079 [Mnemiopsis leidyi]
MEGSKQKLLSNLLKRDESIIGIIVAEKDSAIPVLSSYSPTCSETVDRHRPFIGSTITLMRNSNKLGLGETKRVCATYEDKNVVNIFYKQWVIIIIGKSDSSLGGMLSLENEIYQCIADLPVLPDD